MNNVILQPGDIFCTRNPMALGRIIRSVQKFWDVDNSATYSHSGIILNELGGTFESLWKIRMNSLKEYRGENIIIGRINNRSTIQKLDAIQKVRQRYEGKIYPFWRLPMHLFPPIAKLSLFDIPVCSELVAIYMKELGLIDYWKGVNPDRIADMISYWDDLEIIYEGSYYE